MTNFRIPTISLLILIMCVQVKSNNQNDVFNKKEKTINGQIAVTNDTINSIQKNLDSALREMSHVNLDIAKNKQISKMTHKEVEQRLKNVAKKIFNLEKALKKQQKRLAQLKKKLNKTISRQQRRFSNIKKMELADNKSDSQNSIPKNRELVENVSNDLRGKNITAFPMKDDDFQQKLIIAENQKKSLKRIYIDTIKKRQSLFMKLLKKNGNANDFSKTDRKQQHQITAEIKKLEESLSLIEKQYDGSVKKLEKLVKTRQSDHRLAHGSKTSEGKRDAAQGVLNVHQLKKMTDAAAKKKQIEAKNKRDRAREKAEKEKKLAQKLKADKQRKAAKLSKKRLAKEIKAKREAQKAKKLADAAAKKKQIEAKNKRDRAREKVKKEKNWL